MLIGVLCSLPALADNSFKLEHVYTTTRINAFKDVVRYYNPTISDEVADRIARAIIYYSYKAGIEDDRFVAAVVTVESMFNPYAVSRSGAMGLGQLMPGTARELRVKNTFNIEENIWGSCKYLKKQLERFKHYPRQRRYELTLAAYNAGPGAVQRWGGIPPYRQTRNYVVDVINVWRQLCGLKAVDSCALKSLKKRAAKIRKKRKKKTVVRITRKYVPTTIEVLD